MADGPGDPVDDLVAKHRIKEVVLRYCRGIDRMDESLVRSCFHPDATDEHGSFSGDVDAFIAWVWPLLERYDTTMHLIGNQLVELAGTWARAESYGIAFHRSADGEPHHNLTVGFRFVDWFEQRDDAGPWRVARRVATTEWSRVDPPEQRWPVPTAFRTGRRDRDDVVYEPLPDDG